MSAMSARNAVQLMGGDVREQKMVTMKPGSVCFIREYQ